MKTRTSSWKRLVTDYFIIPKWQRKLAVALFILCLLAVFGPLIYLHFFLPKTFAASPAIVQAETRLSIKEQNTGQNKTGTSQEIYSELAANEETGISLFYFDPNTASFSQWQQLGLRDNTIHTIQNYLAKGGQFRKPEDIRKIYGLRQPDADRLVPYVRIASNASESKSFSDQHSDRTYSSTTYPPKSSSQLPIEINAADSTAFISLPGIGSKLSARIINYREKLHGFYAIDQVGETYGVPDSTFQKIKPRLQVNPALINKIPVNTATADEMKTPLIKFNVANAIIQYRQAHGPFKTLEELKNIPLIDDYLYQRIIHYLSVD